MSNFKKLMMTAAGDESVNVEDVFSSYMYYGTQATQSITNGIDLADNGGLVWTKRKDSYSYQSDFHHLIDTVRGADKILYSNMTSTETTDSNILTSFNANGFTLGSSVRANASSEAYTSWSFRQHPKFFQIKTFTTSYNTDPHYLTHDLECDLGMAIFKSLDNASQANNWIVWHKDSPSNSYFRLNSSSGFIQDNANPIGYDASTKTFTFNYPMSVAGDRMIAGNQATTDFVGYFFADNDGEGEFGSNGDQDIIKCGKYTGNGSSNGPEIDLGFEPQWIIIKRVNSSGLWSIHDNLLGITLPGVSQDRYIDPSTNAPVSTNVEWVGPTSTGFKLKSGNQNASGNNYIYMAIRKGMKAPSSASEVFNVISRPAPAANQPPFPSGFGPVDLFIERDVGATHNWHTMTRMNSLRKLVLDKTDAESNEAFYSLINNPEIMSGISSSFGGQDADEVAWMWKRAEGFCDVVGYTGNGTAGHTISHNLGVEPEMFIVKNRDTSNYNWFAYHKDLGNTTSQALTSAAALSPNTTIWDSTTPTDSVFTLGNNANVNNSGNTYIAYLFASLDGISKVGSYTGNGSAQTIDCGFSSGARFILIKRTDSTGDWYVWDTERGIVAGSDPHLSLNTTAAEVTTDDSIDPVSSGFAVNQVSATNINVSSAEYIFYAIA